MLTAKTNHTTLGRLQKRSDFLRLNKEGRKWVSKTVIVLLTTGEAEQSRCGVTATKKTFPRAVDRNKVKRRLRAVSMEVLPQIFGNQIQDIVLIGRPATLEGDYAVLEKDLRWCLKRLAEQEPEAPGV